MIYVFLAYSHEVDPREDGATFLEGVFASRRDAERHLVRMYNKRTSDEPVETYQEMVYRKLDETWTVERHELSGEAEEDEKKTNARRLGDAVPPEVGEAAERS